MVKVRSAKLGLPKMASDLRGDEIGRTKAGHHGGEKRDDHKGHGQVDQVGPQDELAGSHLAPRQLPPSLRVSAWEPEAGIEPATSSLQVKCSTN